MIGVGLRRPSWNKPAEAKRERELPRAAYSPVQMAKVRSVSQALRH